MEIYWKVTTRNHFPQNSGCTCKTKYNSILCCDKSMEKIVKLVANGNHLHEFD